VERGVRKKQVRAGNRSTNSQEKPNPTGYADKPREKGKQGDSPHKNVDIAIRPAREKKRKG